MKFVPGHFPAVHQRVRKLLPQLPNEIWIHIHGYLEKEDLAKIFSLSPILLDFWMRTIYTQVKACSMKHPLHIMNSITPLAATYVSELVICPQFFEGFVSLPLASSATSGSSTISVHRMKSWIGHPKTIQINVRMLFEKVTQMMNLKSIVVDCIHGRQSWKYFQRADVFIDATMSHSERLEILELHLPLRCLENTLSFKHPISKLQSLSVSIWLAPEYAISIEPQLARLIWFVDIHATSLQRLSLDSPDSAINLMTILSSLGRIPNLREICLGLDNQMLQPGAVNRAKLERFLHAYAQQLEKLNILVYAYGSLINLNPEPFEYDLFKIDFPSLKTVQVALKEPRYIPPSSSTFFTPPLPAGLTYLTKQRSILQNLTLKTRHVSAEELRLIATALGGAKSSLLNLGIQMEIFDPDLLAILALNLPNLRELDIGNTNLHDPSFQMTANEKRRRFLDAMSNFHPALDAWGLRHFRFVILYNLDCWVHIRQAVLQKLPNVITFNDYTREEAMSAQALYPK
ncbi:hypothetical protein CPB83DRAFT_849018 [Crepidotus variabilis]|uniref:F-box domain-containing protein n=1 Tax=Crepidotus variabilis TaxID=179855 RepID=A0A9P6ELR0_9AGAR|nr:hypothetical protein CPB83DRAFT_849018 [Crepidotus variabilis]